MTPLPPLPPLPVTLVCPSISLPNKTAAMYARLTAGHYSDGGVTRRMIEILAGGQFVGESVAGLVHNVFEVAASQAFPDLGWLQPKLNGLSPSGFHLSGAGPALYSLPSSEDEFQRVSSALQDYGVGVYLVNTVAAGPESQFSGWSSFS